LTNRDSLISYVMIFIYEDSWENYEPLSLLRPVSEIRCGTLTFRQKIEGLFKDDVRLIVRDRMPDLCLEQWPQASRGINDVLQGRHLFIAAGSIFPAQLSIAGYDNILVDEKERILGFETDSLAGYQSAESVADYLERSTLQKHTVPGRRILYPWEIFAGLELEVTRDFMGSLSKGTIDSHAVVYGDALRIEEGAVVEAGVTIDCRKGPVTVACNALIKGPTLVEGPVYVGEKTIVDSARLRAGTVLGPQCRVGGEVEASILHGYVNKHHEGFIGHAYLGEWVNLGAMTTNSDLKNNYSEIRVVTNGEEYSTGLTKFGCIVGDHTKTAIGTLIPTGAIIGVFANILGGGLCSKNVPSFSWGEESVYSLAQLSETAEKVMARRDVGMGKTLLEYISALHSEHTQDVG
jgi:UDP-N-acetylglucosamine diphosphorylase/glucosamine-1-phosphate N-acetyltransferase